MKKDLKNLSVLMLFIRSTLYKLLMIILAMAAAETIFFARAFRNFQGFFMLDKILSASYLEITCGVCFFILWALLCLTGCELGSKQGYTLMRLRISQRMIFIWQAVHNAGILFLFWTAQIVLIYGFCSFYTFRYPQPQAAMLVFYSNKFLHNLLPLADWSRLIYNISLFLSLAVTAACLPVRLRRRKLPAAAIVAFSFCIQSFGIAMGNLGLNLFFSALMIFIAVLAVRGIWKEGEELGDEAVS